MLPLAFALSYVSRDDMPNIGSNVSIFTIGRHTVFETLLSTQTAYISLHKRVMAA